MKRAFLAILVSIFLIGVADAQLPVCNVAAQIYDVAGQPRANFRITVGRVIKNGQLISRTPITYTTNVSGQVTIPLPQGSTAYIYANAYALDANGTAGVPLSIPAQSSANLESLANLATVLITLGDTLYGGVNGVPTRRAGNITTTPNFFTEVGTGSASAAPEWWSLVPGTNVTLTYNTVAKTVTIASGIPAFTATASATVANTTVETTILGSGVGTKTVQAGLLQVGRTIRIRVMGTITNIATPTLQIRVKLGSSIVIDTAATTMTTITGTGQCEVVADLTCRTVGATGTVFGQGYLNYNNGTTRITNVGVNTATSTIDTTVAQTIDVTAQWGIASVSNVITGTNVTIEYLNGQDWISWLILVLLLPEIARRLKAASKHRSYGRRVS